IVADGEVRRGEPAWRRFFPVNAACLPYGGRLLSSPTGGTSMTQRLLVLVSLLVVFFGSATAAADQGKVVTIAENVVLSTPGATIDFPALDMRLVSEVALLGKTSSGVSVFVKFSTVAGVFGD